MKQLAKRIYHNQFLRSGFIFTLTNLAITLLNYFSNLLIARFFSLELYGEYSTSLSYTAIFAVPLTTISLIIIKKISSKPKSDQPTEIARLEKSLIHIFRKDFLLMILIGLIISYLLYIKSNLLPLSVLFIITSTIISFWVTFYNACLQAQQLFLLSSIYMAIATLVKLLLVIFAGLLYPNLNIVYLSYILAGVAILLVTKKYFVLPTSITITNNPKSLLNQIREPQNLITFFSNLGLVGLLNLDLIMAKKILSPDNAGLYASLTTMGKIVIYLTTPLTAVAFTYFAKHKANHRLITFASMLLFSILGLTIFMVYLIFPKTIILLIFGTKYLNISSIIYLAAVYGTLYTIMNLIVYRYLSVHSKLALLPIFALITQYLLINSYHQSEAQIMISNILNITLILGVYISIYFYRFFNVKD